jgi:chromosome partitioning protein
MYRGICLYMPLIVTTCALKGGVGKTTIATNLATCLYSAGHHKVLLVDTDGQGSVQQWAAVAAESEIDVPPVIGMQGRTLRKDLPRIAEPFDVVVIDTPPQLAVEAKAALVLADLAIIPVAPGAVDMWSLQKTLEVVEEAHILCSGLKSVIVPNKTDRTTLSKMVNKSLGELTVQALSVGLGSRVAFGEAMLAGQGVVTYAPKSKAAREVILLTKALLKVMEV